MFPCCSLPDKENDPEDVLDAGKEDAHDGAQVGLPGGGGGVLGRNYNRKRFRVHNLHRAILWRRIVGLSSYVYRTQYFINPTKKSGAAFLGLGVLKFSCLT
jgi:hypothetical protein